LERKRRALVTNGRLWYLTALSFTRNFQASDPRDKVFALLSFSSQMQYTKNTGGGAAAEVIRPDYSKSVKEVYVSVAICLIDILGPRIFSLVGNGRGLEKYELPSWTPDLTSPMRYKPLDPHVSTLLRGAFDRKHDTHNANPVRITQPVEVIASQYLALRGHRWDTIVDLSQPGLGQIHDMASGLEDWIRLATKAQQTYPEGILKTLWRTIICDEAGGIQPAPDITQHFCAWLKLVAFIEIIGCTSEMSEQLMNTMGSNHELSLKRSHDEMVAVLEAVKRSFEALQVTLTPKEEREWREISLFQKRWNSWGCWYLAFTDTAQHFGEIIYHKDMSRRLFLTEGGYLGNGAEGTQPGDLVYILPGTSVPYIFREVSEGCFQVIGEAYVHGVVLGDSVDEGILDLEDMYIV